jgi:hypothetical protein
MLSGFLRAASRSFPQITDSEPDSISGLVYLEADPMSTITRRRNTAKARIDRAIRAALRSAGRHFRTFGAFEHLLRQVRGRSDLLRPARVGGHIETKVQAEIIGGLLSLAFHHEDWLRPVEQWTPRGMSIYPEFSALAGHLLARYPVPAFMIKVWMRDQTAEARRQQRWYKHLGLGRNIRSADIPLAYTKMMAHHFVQAPHHLTVEAALRWGQVRGLGGSKDLASAVIATRLGWSFEDEEFWRTVIHYFVNHRGLDPAQVGPIVDYLHNQRFVPQEALIEEGDLVDLGPPQPNLSMKGRTPTSLVRQVAAWHETLRHPPRIVPLHWKRSGIGEFRLVEPDGPQGLRCWTIRELLSSDELYREGEAMRHCVATYVRACARRETSIWSMRFEDGRRRYRVMTIEVDRATRTLCQARRRGNAPPNAKIRGVLERWADQEGLKSEYWCDGAVVRG